VEFDASFIGLDESRDHVEDCRLAGAVGAEEADSLALAHVKTDALDDLTPNEALLHAVDGKHVLAARRRGAVAVGSAARPDRRLGNVFRRRFGLRSVFWLRSALRLRQTLAACLSCRRRQAGDIDIGAVDRTADAGEV